MSKKQRDLQPELNKLKERYKGDQKKLAEEQMALFKKHGVNPSTGCLTTIVTLILMIAIYRAVGFTTTQNKVDKKIDLHQINSRLYSKDLNVDSINVKFLYLEDLSVRDKYMISTIFAVVLQFLAMKMIMPYSEESEKAATKTPSKTDDLMASMQKQNLYMTPLMFLIFGMALPSGVMIYMITSTLFQIWQTWYFNGWGGLKPFINKLKSAKSKI